MMSRKTTSALKSGFGFAGSKMGGYGAQGGEEEQFVLEFDDLTQQMKEALIIHG